MDEIIIFLDIDGVLNSNHEELLEEESIFLLNKLIKLTNGKVVIISSWFYPETPGIKEKVINVLINKGVEFINGVDFIDPNYTGQIENIKLAPRTIGIINYINDNDIKKHIILDDQYDNDYELCNLNYYKTDSFKGLTKDDYLKISQNFNFKLKKIPNISFYKVKKKIR